MGEQRFYETRQPHDPLTRPRNTRSAQQQNPDGSWSTAVPLGWQGPENQVDFEVSRGVAHWIGDGSCRDEQVTGTIVAWTRLGFIVKARRRVGWRTPVTFLWDAK